MKTLFTIIALIALTGCHTTPDEQSRRLWEQHEQRNAVRLQELDAVMNRMERSN